MKKEGGKEDRRQGDSDVVLHAHLSSPSVSSRSPPADSCVRLEMRSFESENLLKISDRNDSNCNLAESNQITVQVGGKCVIMKTQRSHIKLCDGDVEH